MSYNDSYRSGVEKNKPQSGGTFTVLNRFEIFDERLLFRICQSESKDSVVVINHIEQGSETAVMIKAALVDFLGIEERA